MSYTVRDTVIDLLNELGMTTIFGNPGSTELPMFRDYPDHFRYVLGLQESIVMAMADGYAQAKRSAALVNLHSSAGVGHSLGNLFTAFRNQTPLVITAGQQARSILPYEPFLFAERATEFPRPYVKWACEPARAEDVPGAIARAFHVAMQPPRGPTFVSIPVDDWDRPCAPLPAIATIAQSIEGDAALLARAARALSDAKSPAFVVGAGVGRDDAWDEIIALAQQHQAAVYVAPMSARNSFPEDHPLFQGFLPASREGIVAALTGHDILLVAGGPAFTYHVEGFGPFLPEGAKLFQLVDDPAQAAWLPEGVSIITSLKPGLAALLSGSTPVKRPAPPARPRPKPPVPGTDTWLLDRLAALRPDNSVIVEEAPSSRGPMHDYLPILARDGFYTCASGGLGHGLPASVGVALARPERHIIALLGDGSAMYAIQGLWTAANLGLNMTFIIVNNRRYEALIGFGRHFGLQRTVGTELDGLDFVSIAKGQGIRGIRVAAQGTELEEALSAAFGAKGPMLVEVSVD